MTFLSDTKRDIAPISKQEPDSETLSCRGNNAGADRLGEVRCPVCHHLVPSEHIGYKLHCRRCGYLESCCNPI